jgi:MIP family channel proteins
LGRPSLARRCLAEGLGAFALVFAGCGAIVVDAERGGSLGATGVAATFGLVIMAMVYATGHLSGAHLNPAVTIAFGALRRFPAREVLAYVPAQLAGAIGAALLLGRLWPGQPAELGATRPASGIDSTVALTYELVLTAMLMFVIMAVATDTRAVGAAAALAIGGTVALDSLFGGGVTGASMNPGRSIGPAVAVWSWSDLWIYLVGPLAGALVGAALYQLVRHEPATAHAPRQDATA